MRAVPTLTLAVCTAVALATTVSAQERSAPPGVVPVNPVQVNEVRVKQPSPPPLPQRPTFGIERPIDPGFISRPFPVTEPRASTRPRTTGRHQGRSRSHEFRSRFPVSPGIVVGYPILYPFAYPYDPFSPTTYGSSPYAAPKPSPNTYSNVPNTYSSVSSFPADSSGAGAASPLPGALTCEGAAPCGGVSFDLTPANAQVYVDGVFAGTAENFDSTSAPLVLAPGAHYIEIRLPGYRTAAFDVTIAQGEITPYHGTLERLRVGTP